METHPATCNVKPLEEFKPSYPRRRALNDALWRGCLYLNRHPFKCPFHRMSEKNGRLLARGHPGLNFPPERECLWNALHLSHRGRTETAVPEGWGSGFRSFWKRLPFTEARGAISSAALSSVAPSSCSLHVPGKVPVSPSDVFPWSTLVSQAWV